MVKNDEHDGAGPYLQTLGRGLMALELLRDGPMGVVELGRRLGLSRPTSYRVLKTLEHHGWATRQNDEGDYRLSPKVWEIAAAVLPEAVLQEVLQQNARVLLDTWGETVHVAIYDRGDVVYIHKRDGTFPIRSYTELGGRAPAHAVATGKALLAFQEDSELRQVLADVAADELWRPRLDGLKTELEKIRETGVAFNRGDWRHDVGGIAVPIVAPDGGVLVAIGLSGPVPRIFDEQDGKVADLNRVRSEVEAGLH